MSLFSSLSLQHVKNEMLEISTQCSLRGLVQSMKWSAELAAALPSSDENLEIMSNELNKDKLFLKEYDKYCLGKGYFDCKEFSRASLYLKDCKSKLCQFLYFYSRYMEYEKKKKYQFVDVLDEKAAEKQDWQELIDLRDDLKKNEDNLDSYGFYLYGIVLKNLDLTKEAIENLECSIQMEPLFWAAWQELSTLCKDRQMLKELKVPKHWMSEFFYSSVELELHMAEEALTRYQDISAAGFNGSSYVNSQIAICLYNLRDFDNSVEYFRELYDADPEMLEHIDVYSNILYIQEDRPELSHLAHHVCKVDKYRTESCVVIGNYYSLRGDHDKAVMYFKQALRLNSNYVAAWTLLGHEYVELKNTSAAILSYRKATGVNPHDFRGWYGLGQTYELLNMPFYSLCYFKEAQKLRPNDPRMLIALGDTYNTIENLNEAKKCFLRAVRLGDSEGQAIVKLGRLQEQCNEMEEAALSYTKYIKRLENSVHISEDIAHACLFLARHHLDLKQYDEATTYARKAMEYTESRDEGKTLMFEISQMSSSVK
ncbi:cell division cycle protein 23 homolog [Clytia hemisphaerica]|uniref:Cdc23 domain-containing protein n=1 Tax=Clytia hemisphaerica TaxID=252671 RepID=A0A7M6DNZ8_9CNID